MAKLLMVPKVLMVALQDEEWEEEPLHLVAPDMAGTTERGPLDKAPAPASPEAAGDEEDDGDLDGDLEDVCFRLFTTPEMILNQDL